MGLKSMTAFATAELQNDATGYICEIRTLNSRYLEVNVRFPRFLSALEADVIRLAKAKLGRGKVEISVSLQMETNSRDLPQVNRSAVEHYLRCSQIVTEIAKNLDTSELGLAALSLSELMRFDGVLETGREASKTQKVEEHRNPLLKTVEKALEGATNERKREGETLTSALLEMLELLKMDRSALHSMLDDLNKSVFDSYSKRIQRTLKRMAEDGALTGEIPKERLLQEIAILAEKADIDEELTRLGCHIEEFSKTLEASEPVGKKLDFLCQELHRETNTISNKLMHLEAAKHTRNLKQTIDRIRQQVQNIE